MFTPVKLASHGHEGRPKAGRHSEQPIFRVGGEVPDHCPQIARFRAARASTDGMAPVPISTPLPSTSSSGTSPAGSLRSPSGRPRPSRRLTRRLPGAARHLLG